MPKPIECFRTSFGIANIVLEQLGRDNFRVTYGKQVDEGDYGHASQKLGEAIFHALACEGVLDNREKSGPYSTVRKHYFRDDFIN